MSLDFENRLYKEGDEYKIVPLLQAAFKKWPFFDIKCSPVDHWQWRYKDNPLKKSLLTVIEKDDNIVGCAHNILNNIKINGVNYLGAYGSDHCVHPECEGKGLSKKLHSSICDMREQAGVKFAYMITINPKIVNSSARATTYPHDFPHSIVYLSRIDDINKHIQMKEITKEHQTRIKHYFENLLKHPLKPLSTCIEISPVKEFDGRIEKFIEKINKSHVFLIERTHEYLNWRYCDPRSGDYDIRIVEEEGDIAGYCVFRINRIEEYHEGYIVDLLTLPGRLDLAEELLLSGLHYFKENGVNVISYQVVKGHPYERLFNRYGFHGGEADRRVFYYKQSDEDINIENISPETIHFSFGDITGI